MDPITEILAAMRVEKATFYRVEATAPWGFASAGEPVMKFVYVMRGAAVLTTASQPAPVPLRAGDVFIMFDAEPYSIFDDLRSAAIDCMVVEKMRVGSRIDVGGGGALTTCISGFFQVNAERVRPLLEALPKFLHLKSEQARTLAFQSVLELLAAETEDAMIGSDAVIGRLFELLFVHAIRAHASQTPTATRSWLAAISDRNLGPVIRSMHASLDEGWTVESLARLAGMSRSAFAARFKNVVGEAPLEYLTRWRIHKAIQMLRSGQHSLSAISANIGYESEASLNRVFKRAVGMTPGAFRRNVTMRRYQDSAE